MNSDKYNGTLVICKSGEFIAGGYTDQSWSGKGFKESSRSFLFSLNKVKKYFVQQKKYAIFCKEDLFPIFGCSIMSQFDYEPVRL